MTLSQDPLIFEKKGFPIVKLYEDYFEVKAIDFWNYRTFQFSEVKDIEYYNVTKKWWYKLMHSGSWQTLFDHQVPSTLKIKKLNGGSWEYDCPHEKDDELMSLVLFLKEKVNAYKS